MADMRVELQTHNEDRGFSDMELRCGDELHAVLEAKQGFCGRRCPRGRPGAGWRTWLVRVEAPQTFLGGVDGQTALLMASKRKEKQDRSAGPNLDRRRVLSSLA